jgi:carbamoyltransferase
MYILGISGQERNAAAALICDGQVVAAIEEDDLARIRHIGMTYNGGLPHRAIEFCLKRAGIKFDQLDFVAYYLDPHKLFRREIAFFASCGIPKSDAQVEDIFPPYFVESLNSLKERLRTRALIESRLSPKARFIVVDHQLAHGASAFYPSGFERAAVISVGNRGDMATTALMSGSNNTLSLHAETLFPNSVGMVYGAVTAALGFNIEGDWHKTMWLSPTGEPEFAELFRDMISIDSRGLPMINPTYFDTSRGRGFSLSQAFFDRAGLKPQRKGEPIGRVHRNVACSLQLRVEDLLCEIAARHRERTGEDYLCLAGGVSFNSLANAAIERRAGYKRMFVQPAAGNAGCSLGAALYVWHQVLGHAERVYKMEHAFLGPRFDDEEIKAVLDNCKLHYEYFAAENRLIGEVAHTLSRGNIVGWFQGAMEFGPRTLGARSIFASPLNEVMRDNLNHYVKHREDFRPFSAAVPVERVADFFEPSTLTEFIQAVSRIKDEHRSLIPAAVFGDGMARVHTVSSKTNKPFWKLLMRFGEITGVPVLLNTSFNLFGEPVVSTPREAVRSFYCSGIDCLAIGNFLVRK